MTRWGMLQSPFGEPADTTNELCHQTVKYAFFQSLRTPPDRRRCGLAAKWPESAFSVHNYSGRRPQIQRRRGFPPFRSLGAGTVFVAGRSGKEALMKRAAEFVHAIDKRRHVLGCGKLRDTVPEIENMSLTRAV